MINYDNYSINNYNCQIKAIKKNQPTAKNRIKTEDFFTTISFFEGEV